MALYIILGIAAFCLMEFIAWSLLVHNRPKPKQIFMYTVY